MAETNKTGVAGDPHNLGRFVQAQEHDYQRALSEISSGRKRSHWMWYIFPQFEGLGFSATSRRYSIKSVAEAEAYLSHPVLGPRLRGVRRGGPPRRGSVRTRDLRGPRRHEAEILRHPLRLRLARGFGVPSADRQVFPG